MRNGWATCGWRAQLYHAFCPFAHLRTKRMPTLFALADVMNKQSYENKCLYSYSQLEIHFHNIYIFAKAIEQIRWSDP